MTQFKLRHFVLPLIALAIIASLPPPAASGRGETCGPAAPHVRSATLRIALEDFDRTQSAAAAKVCALHRNAN
jgi:hypothetical protein